MKSVCLLLAIATQTIMSSVGATTVFAHSGNSIKKCASKERTAKQMDRSKEVFEKWRPKLQQLRLRGGVANTIEIPTYVHVMRADDGSGGVEKKNIKKQLKLMNKYYEPHFKFIQKEITYTDNTEWQTNMFYYTDQEKDMMSAVHMGGRNSVNIIIVEETINDYWGYSYLPEELDSDNPMLDYFLIIGSSMPLTPYDETTLGHTATHEAGHWLGLYHTFEGGCRGYGDGVSDTPPQKSASYGCPIGRDSCQGGGKDPIHNFMDYTDDTCMNEFTDGQVDRMLSQWYEYRCVDSETWSYTKKGKKKGCSSMGGNPKKRCKKIGRDKAKQPGKAPASLSCCKSCAEF